MLILVPNPKKRIYLSIFLILVIIGAVFAFSFLKNKNNQTIKLIENTKTVQQKASDAGWEIAWQGDPKDLTGRTLLAKGKRSKELMPDKFYWTQDYNKDLKISSYIYGMGIFDHWEDKAVIVGSNVGTKARYMILQNPLSKSTWGEDKEIKVRVIFDPEHENRDKGTQLMVENLDYGYKNQKVAPSSIIGSFGNLKLEKINSLIKKGDVVAVFPIISSSTSGDLKTLNKLDEEDIGIAETVLIRRFGGKNGL